MKIKLRRGFKTEAEKYACDYRAELNLGKTAPLDMFRLAEHLAIPTHPLSKLKDHLSTEIYEVFTMADKKVFSAVTLYEKGSKCFILYNDANAKARQQSDVAHELSHVILGHSPNEFINYSTGGRHYDELLEDEANCLAGVLLVPKDAAFQLLKSKISYIEAAEKYQISEQMIRKRINESGAAKVMARSTAMWGN